jgi:hypothetical protein
MNLERTALLVRRIAEKSKVGALEWREEASNSFVADVGHYRVGISQHDSELDQYTDPDYSISIRAMAGERWIDSFTDEDLKEALPGSFKLMQALFRDARRQARGVGDIVEDLLTELGEPKL